MYKKSDIIVSYMTLRNLIGWLGIALSAVCVLGGLAFDTFGIGTSISFYYHTNMRDVLVGVLVAMSLFLFCYNGYDAKDKLVATISGIAGLGIAIFPSVNLADKTSLVGVFQTNPIFSGIVHGVSAGIFFVLLAYNSYFLFTKTDASKPMTPNKVKRNKLYKLCGIIIMVSLGVFCINGIFKIWPYITLITEAVMLVAFGISWIIKGETILKDAE